MDKKQSQFEKIYCDLIKYFESKNTCEENYLEDLSEGSQEKIIEDWSVNEHIDKENDAVCASNLDDSLSFLKKVLNKLSTLEKEIIHKYFWKNSDENQISNELGIPICRVKILKEGIIKKLRDAYSKYFTFDELKNFSVLYY